MIHQHGKWSVEVSDDPEFRGDHFDAAFRLAIRAGRKCELFTLFDDDRPKSENAIIQILIFSAGMIQLWCYAPCMVQCHPKDKVILVGVCRPESLSFPPPKRKSPRKPAA